MNELIKTTITVEDDGEGGTQLAVYELRRIAVVPYTEALKDTFLRCDAIEG